MMASIFKNMTASHLYLFFWDLSLGILYPFVWLLFSFWEFVLLLCSGHQSFVISVVSYILNCIIFNFILCKLWIHYSCSISPTFPIYLCSVWISNCKWKADILKYDFFWTVYLPLICFFICLFDFTKQCSPYTDKVALE